MTLDALLARLQNDNRQRLRWRVLRQFGVLPGSKEARRMSDIDCLICGLHLLLDTGFGSGETRERNPAFDAARFHELEGGAE